MLYQKLCQKCGGDLRKVGDTHYACVSCNTTYSTEKIEGALANAKQNLYKAVSADNISKDEVKKWCDEVKKYLPNDFQANFYYDYIEKSEKEVLQIIMNINVEEQYEYLETLIVFVIKSLKKAYVAAIKELIESIYKDKNKDKYNEYTSKVEEEAEKLDKCVYVTKIQRAAFIAYSSKDKKKAMELVEYLERQNLKCFISSRNLRHGVGSREYYNEALKEAMDYCTTFVFVSSMNSRNVDCDAFKIEMPYIIEKDKKNAPGNLRNDYSKIPKEYKKHRVEYRIEESKDDNDADDFVDDFFCGYERVHSIKEVSKRIIQHTLENPIEKTMETPIETPIKKDPPVVKKVKFCVDCQSKCDEGVKECDVCGGTNFASSLNEAKKLKKEEKDRQKKRAKIQKEQEKQREKNQVEREKAQKKKAQKQEKLKKEQDKKSKKQAKYQSKNNKKEANKKQHEKNFSVDIREKTFNDEFKSFASNSHSAKKEKPNKSSTSRDTIKPKKNINFKWIFGILILAVIVTTIIVRENQKDKMVIENGVLLSYKGKDSVVVIPEEVTVIEDGAFSNWNPQHKLTEVVLSNNIVSIGEKAFKNCDKLEKITIPSSVEFIESNAFEGCENLISVVIEDGVCEIGTKAFNKCVALRKIEIPGSVKTIGSYAFSGCTKLSEVIFNEGTLEIGTYAFDKCTSIRNVVLPKSLEILSTAAFSNCDNISKIYIRSNIKKIGLNVLLGAKNVKIYYEGSKSEWDKVDKGILLFEWSGGSVGSEMIYDAAPETVLPNKTIVDEIPTEPVETSEPAMYCILPKKNKEAMTIA